MPGKIVGRWDIFDELWVVGGADVDGCDDWGEGGVRLVHWDGVNGVAVNFADVKVSGAR